MSLSGLCTSFSKVTLFSLPEVSVDLKYAKNALAAEAPPHIPLGELTTLPQTLGSGGGYPSHFPPHSLRIGKHLIENLVNAAPPIIHLQYAYER